MSKRFKPMFETVYVFNYREEPTGTLAKFERRDYLFKAPVWFARLFCNVVGGHDYATTPLGY